MSNFQKNSKDYGEPDITYQLAGCAEQRPLGIPMGDACSARTTTASTPNLVNAAADSARARHSASPSPVDCYTAATSCCLTRSAVPSTNPQNANYTIVSLRPTHKRPCFSSPIEQLLASYVTKKFH